MDSVRRWRTSGLYALAAVLSPGVALPAPQQSGSIRGVVYDKDFGAPLPGAQVTIAETRERVTTSDTGHYVFRQVAPDTYTLFFTKEGYIRKVEADVVVTAGRLTDVDASLSGEFTELEEYVVQDLLAVGGDTEAGLLALRYDSPALLDSVSSDLMSRAGASDAASALRLVAGASVKDDKSAVVRGLPDRYVSSQMNGVRLPTSDEDKRAVELDQFPASVLESIQVSKTFTPDQHGDASGGAVDVRLKRIPDETIFEFKGQVGYNSQVTGRDDFLSYDGGGVDFWGKDDGDRDIQWDRLGENWKGAAGVSTTDAPLDYKWSTALGGKRELEDGVKIGGLASFFYERDSSFVDDGVNDSWWVESPGAKMTPRTKGGSGAFTTSLFDVQQATEGVQWGGLATVGLETENHAVGLTYLYTHTAEDRATLAEDTRGKEYFFPDYDVDNKNHPGNQNVEAAPYLRSQALEYTERTTETAQLNGRHTLPLGDFALGNVLRFLDPVFDWTVAASSASLDQPDKRLFGSRWEPGFDVPPIHKGFSGQLDLSSGFFNRIWKEIEEDSNQIFSNLELPFEQWGGHPGSLKVGMFRDDLDRKFDQDTFVNSDTTSIYIGGWDKYWSDEWPDQDHPIVAADSDVDYDGELNIDAWYSMLDLPLFESLRVVGGARVESTELGIVNAAEEDVLWIPPDTGILEKLDPGEADVEIDEEDTLPSVALIYEPIDQITLRGSYSRTVARQTFKELTPVIQREFVGGPLFVGNPDLEMSSVENYDLRLDYRPYEGSLVSVSWFHKDIEDPIEYVQKEVDLAYTTAENYPEGELDGIEVELRQHLGHFWESMEGLSVGANATFLDSEVTIPEEEADGFEALEVPMETRDMTNAPDFLYNLFLTYDIASTGTGIGLFYTVQGDTLVAGAAESSDRFVPSVYATEYDTLNLTVTQRLNRWFSLKLQAKNLTNPAIETVYRNEPADEEVVRTKYTKGIEYTLGFSFNLSF